MVLRITLDLSDPTDPILVVDQIAPLTHPVAGDGPLVEHDDAVVLSVPGDFPELAGVSVVKTTTVTDFDGDVATDSAEVNVTSSIVIEDDGPTIDVEGAENAMLALAALDETPGDSAVPGDDNAGDDEPPAAGAIGTMTSAAGAVAGLFVTNAIDFGRDGPLAGGGLEAAYSLVLRDAGGTEILDDTGVATTLFATGNGDGVREEAERIFLFRISDTEIVGIAGNDPGGDVILRITLDLTNPADPIFQVDQIAALEHPLAGATPLVAHDDPVTLGILNATVGSAGVSIRNAITATDGDLDTASDTAEVNVTSSITIEDDGPQLGALSDGTMVTHDETPGIDDDADDTAAPAVVALFAGVTNPGVDPDMPAGLCPGRGSHRHGAGPRLRCRRAGRVRPAGSCLRPARAGNGFRARDHRRDRYLPLPGEWLGGRPGGQRER